MPEPEGGDDPVVLRLAEQVADGREVDWVEESAELGARDGSERTRPLEGLRLIAEVAGAFRRHRDETAPSSESSPPARLFRWGRLDVLERLGEGGFGEVFRAYDPQLDRHVALKLQRRTADAGVLRSLGEARRLARIRHPNVLAIDGADVHDGRAGLWTDLLTGRTLHELVESNGPLGAHEAAGVGVELCRALAAIHHAGLVHGDVKPPQRHARGGRALRPDGLRCGARAASRLCAGTGNDGDGGAGGAGRRCADACGRPLLAGRHALLPRVRQLPVRLAGGRMGPGAARDLRPDLPGVFGSASRRAPRDAIVGVDRPVCGAYPFPVTEVARNRGRPQPLGCRAKELSWSRRAEKVVASVRP